MQHWATIYIWKGEEGVRRSKRQDSGGPAGETSQEGILGMSRKPKIFKRMPAERVFAPRIGEREDIFILLESRFE